jgi:capsular polysaccharide biosynthesis protein
VTSHESSEPILGLDERIEYPELSLHHYSGKIVMVANQLLYTGYTILPDTFRHHLKKNPANRRITNVSPQFARISESFRPGTTLYGNYYHMDSENSRHFGHLLTESVARLRGWYVAKQRIPDLKLVFRTRFPNERDLVLERRIFNAFGIDESDIIWSDRPVFLESVVAATPMWHNQVPFYVHPEIKMSVWDVIADRLVDPDAPNFLRIFVSRQSGGSRHCRDADAVEALFESHGYKIVYPELFGLGIQARVFARDLETVIVLNHEAYTARGGAPFFLIFPL